MTKWIGEPPVTCEMCKGKLGKKFYDARTVSGRWGILCYRCFKVYGCNLGLGSGQEYDTKTLEKTRG